MIEILANISYYDAIICLICKLLKLGKVPGIYYVYTYINMNILNSTKISYHGLTMNLLYIYMFIL